MEYSFSSDFRSRQTRGFGTYTACSSLFQHSDKTDFEHIFCGTNLLHEINQMENPLQKNLRDTHNVDNITDNKSNTEKLLSENIQIENNNKKELPNMEKNSEWGWRTVDIIPTIFGVTNIITGLFKHITSSLVQSSKRVNLDPEKPFLKSDCPVFNVEMDHNDPEFDEWGYDELDASPSIDDDIQHLVLLDHSKNSIEARENTAEANIAQCSARGGRAGSSVCSIMPLPELVDPAETCQAKMAKIKELLAGKCSNREKSNKSYKYRPKKIFIDPKFIKEKTVETFEPEQLGRLESVDTTDFVNPGVITSSDLTPAETLPRVKLVNDLSKPEAVEEQTKSLEKKNTSKFENEKKMQTNCNNNSDICSSTKVTAEINSNLIREIHATESSQIKNSILTPELNENSDIIVPKHYLKQKNPILLDVHKKQKRLPKFTNVEDTTESDEISSVENSPKITVTPPAVQVGGFDEFRGRFESTSLSEQNDDPFVIVFSDGPACVPHRERISSDTSDDSFIVFEDDPDGSKSECFVVEDSCDSDTESDKDSNLDRMGRFSQTQMDLTNESLYCETNDDSKVCKQRVEKKVRFSDAPPQVRVMRVWDYAARQARIGTWRQHAADAERFKRRIADIEMAISWVLKAQHRNRVKFQRFMPWWNQQRRIEEAERKAAEEKREREEKERIEEEQRIEEEMGCPMAGR